MSVIGWERVPYRERPAGYAYPPELRDPAPGADKACWVCGIGPWKGDSTTTWAAPRPPHPHGPINRDTGEYAPQPWRNRHIDCNPQPGPLLSRLLERPVDDQVVVDVVRSFSGALSAVAANETAKRSPFDWMTAAQRARLRSLVEMIEAAAAPQPHPLGRCGVCGTGRSTAWARSSGSTWPDGSPAPLCGSCDRMGVFPDTLSAVEVRRLLALADVAGMRPSIELSADGIFGMKIAADVLRQDERHDDAADRWTYRPDGISAIVEQVRSLRPTLLLDEDERARRLAALDARREGQHHDTEHSGPAVLLGW